AAPRPAPRGTYHSPACRQSRACVRELSVPVHPSRRDLRLDFFRGLALWFIFIDHVPSSAIGRLTFRNFGFSDATEIFVFISGYTAAIVYGRLLARDGFLPMTFEVLKRCWRLYAAHILL